MTERIENIMHPWSSDEKTILLRLQANAADGLSSSEARGRLEFAGLNKIELSKETSLAKIFFNQFTGPFVMLLGAGAIISFYFRDWLDGIAITAVIFINAIVGFIMEFQAGRAMHALRKLTTVPARVMRDGALIEISSEQVVPGDL